MELFKFFASKISENVELPENIDDAGFLRAPAHVPQTAHPQAEHGALDVTRSDAFRPKRDAQLGQTVHHFGRFGHCTVQEEEKESAHHTHVRLHHQTITTQSTSAGYSFKQFTFK